MSGFEQSHSVENQQTQTEIVGDILSIENSFSNINKKYGDKADNFDIFQDFINNLTDIDLQKSVINIMTSGDRRINIKVKKYIKKNAFPTEITMDKFLKKFKIENNKKTNIKLEKEKHDTLTNNKEVIIVGEEKENKIEEKENKIEEKENNIEAEVEEKEKERIDRLDRLEEIKKISELGDSIKKFEGNTHVDTLLTKITKIESTHALINIEEGEKQKLIDIAIRDLTEFISDDTKLAQIADCIAKEAGLDSKEFQIFREKLVAFNPENEKFFRIFEKGFIEDPIQKESLLDTTQLSSVAETGDYKQYGHIMIGDEGDYDAFIDVADIPPSRTIGLKDSNYKLETGMPVLNLKGPIYRYEKAMMIADKDMGKVQGELRGIQIKGREAWETFKETQNTIRLDPEGKSGLLEELFHEQKKELADIKGKVEDKKLEIDAIRERKVVIKKIYLREMNSEKGAYAKELKKHDQKTKKVLEYLHNIGFDVVPQSLTDRLVEHLNGNSSLRTQLGFNEEIDLEEGNLGIDTNAGDTFLDTSDRVAFGEFFMKAIGAPVDIINLNNIKNNSGIAIPDRAKFKTYINNSGIMGDAGFGLMLDNLKQITKDPDEV